MNWVISLLMRQDERIENRVLKIVEYLTKTFNISMVEIRDLDATGFLGNKYTHLLNEQGWFSISKEDIIELLSEEGQLIDCEVKFLIEKNFYSIIINDGNIVDILSDYKRLPDQVVGLFKEEDPSYYL